MSLHVIRGAGAPSSIPTDTGQHYIDTSSGIAYISTGTSSSSDWKISNSAVNSVFGRVGAVTAQSGDYTYTDVGADASGAAATVQSNLNSHTGNTSNPHSVTKTQVGLGNVQNLDQTNPANITQDATHRFATDTEKTTWNSKVDSNSAITGATKTKITYDSKGLVTAGADTTLNDNTDVLIATPVLNDVMKYNGTHWVNDQIVIPTSGGAGVNYFLSNTASGIGGYDLMSKTPDSASEVDESTVANNNTVFLEGYIADAAIGGTQVDPGLWNFNLYSYVSQNTGVSTITVDVYKRTSGGTETLLFSVTSPEINDLTVALFNLETVQPAFSCNATDKLVFKFSVSTTAVVNTTIHLVHSGTTHYSFINTPLITRHNDLAGIQGGASDEHYHLTASEYTGTGTGDFVRSNSPNITTPTGILKSDVGLSNVDNTSDLNKPISTATQTALNAKEPTVTATTSADYYRGDKTFQPLDKTAVGLSNVNNTADSAKTISGDVTGTLSTSTVAKLQNRTMAATAPANGQAVVWNSGASQWEPQTIAGGAGSTSVTVSNSTLTMTSASTSYQIFTGTTHGQKVTLPDATTLVAGENDYFLINKSSTMIPIYFSGGTFAIMLYPDSYLECLVTNISSAAGLWLLESANPNIVNQPIKMDDFMNAGTASGSIGDQGWTLTSSGGTGAVAIQAALAGHPGIIQVSTTNTNNAAIALNLGASMTILGDGVTVFETLVYFPALGGTGAAAFTARFGLSDTTSGADATNGVYFEYAGTAAGTINWFLKTANASTRTSVDSTIAVAATTWYKLSFVVNAAGNSVGFYINNNFVGTTPITTNIPTAAIGLSMRNTSGATNAAAKSFWTDFVYYQKTLTTVR